MAPIRTAIIGLSANAVTNWAKVAHLPYLISPAGKSKFKIVALCNSSVEAAKSAITAFKLDPETRAYGSPEDLAADKDVDFVIVSTRVDKHYETAIPSIRAGKNVYVEWPLADNVVRARELTELAKEKGGRTVVGLQGLFAPPVVKLKELIENGRIGKVLSSEVRANGGGNDRTTLNSGLKYFTDKRVGGNVFTIGVGHLSDIVQSVLGEIHDVQSQVQIQRPDVKLVDPSSGKVTEVVKSDVPDLFLIIGSISESENVVQGASIGLRYRRGQAFKGEPSFLWTINGEKGEIRVSSHTGPGVNANSEDVVIELHDFETDAVEKVDWEWGANAEYPATAKNIASLYEAYADGDESKYATFAHALKRHEQLDGIFPYAS